jgi:hypothetical protein
MATAEHTKRFEPLGYTRRRLLSCLGGDIPSFPHYLKLAPGEDVFSAFRAFVQRMIEVCAPDQSPQARTLIGASRLLIGDVSGADEVLDHLQAEPVRFHKGAGYCDIIPLQAMQVALPLPTSLQDWSRWLEGSSEQAALRAWLGLHRRQLAWDETRGVYRIEAATSPRESSI